MHLILCHIHLPLMLQGAATQLLISGPESYDQPRQHIKKQRHYFDNKELSSRGYGFSSSRVWMWELDYKESWAPKNWCFWTVVLEKTLESPLDCKEIQPVCPKGDQSLIFIGRTDVEAETPIVRPPDAESWLISKDPDAGKDWGQEEKGTIEDEVAGWHHRLNGHGFGWTPGVGDGQGGLACCSSWDRKESDMTEWLKWTELNWSSLPDMFLLLQESAWPLAQTRSAWELNPQEQPLSNDWQKLVRKYPNSLTSPPPPQ